MFYLETYNKNRAARYCSCIYKLSKISGKYIRDISANEYQKCLIDCVVFNGTCCIIEMLDNVLSFKGEAENIYIRIGENNL